MNITPRSLEKYQRKAWDGVPFMPTSPCVDLRRPVKRADCKTGRFVTWRHQSSRGEESKQGVLLGVPYQTPTSATTYYCRILTPTGIFEKRVQSLDSLDESRQTPELKEELRQAQQSLLNGGIEQLERSVPKIVQLNKEEVLEQLFRDLNSPAIQEALA